MRIAHYQGLWEKSGVASYVRRIIDLQRRAGHEIVYIDRAESGGLQTFFPTAEPVFLADNPGHLWEIVRGEGIDILHAHHAVESVPPAGVSVLRTVHNHRPYCPSRFRYLTRWEKPCPRKFSVAGCLWGYAIDNCSGSLRPDRWLKDFRQTSLEREVLPHLRVVTVSNFVRDEMIRSGYPSENISVLYLPPAEIESAEPQQEGIGGKEFLFMGRLEAAKGVKWLLEEFAGVPAGAVLHIAGDGELEEELRDLSLRLGISDRVRFHGWLSGPMLDRLMRQVRVLVFPSLCHEAGGTAAFEAMARARPVIMTRVGGMAEIVRDGANGLVVAPGAKGELTHAMTRLAQDAELARRLGERGAADIRERFSLSAHVESLMAFYREVAGNRPVYADQTGT